MCRSKCSLSPPEDQNRTFTPMLFWLVLVWLVAVGLFLFRKCKRQRNVRSELSVLKKQEVIITVDMIRSAEMSQAFYRTCLQHVWCLFSLWVWAQVELRNQVYKSSTVFYKDRMRSSPADLRPAHTPVSVCALFHRLTVIKSDQSVIIKESLWLYYSVMCIIHQVWI